MLRLMTLMVLYFESESHKVKTALLSHVSVYRSNLFGTNVCGHPH